MEPINKHTVLKEVRKNGSWKGYIAPNNVNAYHITGGWHLGMELHITSEKNVWTNEIVYYCFFGEGSEPRLTRKLDDVLAEFSHYNCNGELGRRIRFWTAA